MIAPALPGDLKNYTTFGISCIANSIQILDSRAEFLKILQNCQDLKKSYLVLGEGSNVVVPDVGLDKLVLINRTKNILQQNTSLAIDSGTLLSEVVSYAIKNGLEGVEYLSGIPGTIGGAVVGNAGAYGHSISEIIEKVEMWEGGKISVLFADQCQFSYRSSLFRKSKKVILRITIKLKKGNIDKLEGISKEIITIRQQKYPKGLACPGSFFKNILVKELNRNQLAKIDKNKIIMGKVPAGHLLEEVGAKGLYSGDIRVSDFHANLIINRGVGTSQDVINLSNSLKQKVYLRFGIPLEEEVIFIN